MEINHKSRTRKTKHIHIPTLYPSKYFDGRNILKQCFRKGEDERKFLYWIHCSIDFLNTDFTNKLWDTIDFTNSLLHDDLYCLTCVVPFWLLLKYYTQFSNWWPYYRLETIDFMNRNVQFYQLKRSIIRTISSIEEWSWCNQGWLTMMHYVITFAITNQ